MFPLQLSRTNQSRIALVRAVLMPVLVTVIIAAIHRTSGGAIIVNAPRDITHQVIVQMIQTAEDGGTNPATAFDNELRFANIESRIDDIWAQAGVDVRILPALSVWQDSFALHGTSSPRDVSDFAEIFARASLAGVLNPDPYVLNMILVDTVPGAFPVGTNTVDGLSFYGRNGMVIAIGENLPLFQAGRDGIAHVVAHEIGHNLGLTHPFGGAVGLSNLMSPNGATEQLTDAQIDAIFGTEARNDDIASIPFGGTGFLRPITTVPEPTSNAAFLWTMCAACLANRRFRRIKS